MAGNIASIVADYGAAWLEQDAAKRLALLNKAWSDEGVYQDPTADCAGRQALSDHIGGFHKGARGARIVLTSGVDIHHDKIRFTWRMIAANGDTVIEGVDFGTLASDGRLASITGFFGEPAPK